MAQEIARAAAAARTLAETATSLLGMPVAWTDVVEELSTSLEAGNSDNHRSAVLESLSRIWDHRLSIALQDASAHWSELSGLPVAASLTEAGWRRAVGVTSRTRLDAEALSSLPGTPVVNATHRIVTLLSFEDHSPISGVADAYDAAKRYSSFDQALRQLRTAGLGASAQKLAWAVVGFESHRHVNLVWHQANKLQRAFPDRSASDLLAYGWLGLRVALSKFDPSLGFAFSTYACTRITGSIRDGVRAENPVPKRLGTFARKVAAAEASLTQTLGRSPSLEEVSSFLGTEIERLAVLPRLAPEASVDELVEYSSNNGSSPKWLIDDSDPADAVERTLASAAVREALAKLPEDEAEAIRLLVMEDLHPTKARQVTGATARQMRQRRDRGLEALKDFLDGWDPEVVDSN